MTGTVGYLTKRFPRLSETFILDEILGLEAAGVPLRLYAVADPGEAIVQPDVTRVKSPVVYLHAGGGWRQAGREIASTVAAHARLFVHSPRRYLSVVAYIARKRRHLSTVRNFSQAGRLASMLKADGARHLHAAFAHGPASVAHFVHLLTGLPFSFSAHAKDIYVSAPDLLARKVAASSFVLTCSQSAADAMSAIAGPDGAKVLLAHHGVDTSRFTPVFVRSEVVSQAPLRILAVGRMVAKKGYPVLLDALAILAADNRSFCCTVIGAGPDRAEVENLARNLELSSRITFLGSRTHQQVAASYREADVFVQASVVLENGDRDGIPNSLLEAMSSGLAVVASNVAGIPEVVAPGCGLLVVPGEPVALASALALLADDAVLRARLGDAARRHVVTSFDRAVCARALAPLFETPSLPFGAMLPIVACRDVAWPPSRNEKVLG